MKKLSGHHTQIKPPALDRSSRCGSRLITVFMAKNLSHPGSLALPIHQPCCNAAIVVLNLAGSNVVARFLFSLTYELPLSEMEN